MCLIRGYSPLIPHSNNDDWIGPPSKRQQLNYSSGNKSATFTSNAVAINFR